MMGLGKGLGHLCIGCLSLYGELTDVLDIAPSYYDPYSESPIRSRPYVIDIKTGTHAAALALINGWKDGYTDLLNTPRLGYERHGKLGAVTGSLVGLVNGILKPVVGTLSAFTWFCRGIYANVKNEELADKGTEACTVNTVGLDASSTPDVTSEQQKKNFLNDINEAAKAASTVSGFSPEVCQRIISEFDDIKKQKIDYRSRRHKSR